MNESCVFYHEQIKYEMSSFSLSVSVFVRTSPTQPTFIQPTFHLFLGCGPITWSVFLLLRFNQITLFILDVFYLVFGMCFWALSNSLQQWRPELCSLANMETNMHSSQWENQYVFLNLWKHFYNFGLECTLSIILLILWSISSLNQDSWKWCLFRLVNSSIT